VTDEQARQIARETARAVVEALATDQKHHLCDIDPETHAKHHELVDSAIRVMARIEDIKWSVAKFLVVSAVVGILAAIGWNVKGGGQ
jgi:hypothetical protein